MKVFAIALLLFHAFMIFYGVYNGKTPFFALTATPCLVAAYLEYKMKPPRNGWASTAIGLALAKPFAYIYLIHLSGQLDFSNERLQNNVLIPWSIWLVLWGIYLVYLVKTWQKPNET